MPKQIERKKPSGKQKPSETEDEQPGSEVDDDVVNAVLDEIDKVLEENAQEFVRSYIQQGGELYQ